MRLSHLCTIVSTGVIGACLFLTLAAWAQRTGSMEAWAPGALTVEFASICRGVVERNVLNPGTRFPASVGKLYCFTKIVGAQSPTEVTHVWYFKDIERARVSLGVQAASWRTYSSKKIQAHEIGTWHVDVVGPDGTVLTTVHFEIFA